MAEVINSQAGFIERRLTQSLSSTRILSQEVHQQGGVFDDFESYADEIIESVGGISNLQLAPDGIIQFIHPLSGNERAIGHNILKDDHRRKEALMALHKQHMTLAGPFELIQGGVAVIGRNPIFLEKAHSKQRYFWGFASALIYLEDLLSVTDLEDLASKGYSFELSRIHPDSGEKEVFASSKVPVQDRAIQAPVVVPNNAWMLRMSAPTPVSSYWYYFGYFLSVLLAFAVTWLLRKIMIQPKLLQNVVDQKVQELNTLTHNDPLTGLANKLQLKQSVERVIVECQRYHIHCALLVIDLDNFKSINDLFGHDVGDTILVEMAERLSCATRASDVVARIGSDEFGILLLHTDSTEDVSHSIEHILEAIKKPVAVRGQDITLTASVGVATIPHDGAEYMQVYKHADMAMYAAKAAGKNGFYFFDNILHVQAIERLRIEYDLSEALKRDEFELYLQPIITLRNQQLSGYEALVRWNHPTKGLLCPDEFLNIAENTDIIFGLGYWVFAEACHVIQKNNYPVKVSVNLSPRQFRDANLIDNLKAILESTQIDPTLLEMELTESCFIDDIDSAISTTIALSELGISLSLDDFGTGYSSLTLLQRLPVHKLKIDRSFITQVLGSNRDRNIVKGLIVMANEIGLTVVAEGIESQEQFELLRAMGCQLGQGFYFSKPDLAANSLQHVHDMGRKAEASSC